jgi:hypothetical protein
VLLFFSTLVLVNLYKSNTTLIDTVYVCFTVTTHYPAVERRDGKPLLREQHVCCAPPTERALVAGSVRALKKRLTAPVK